MPARAGLVTAIAVILAAASMATTELEGDRAPVPLYKPSPQSPKETAGSGQSPAVSVRVHIDARGKVDEVQVERIEPSTRFDEAYRDATVETLSSWRYAPAIEDGEATDTWLQWTIQYVPRQQGFMFMPTDGDVQPTHLLLSQGTKRIDRRWEIVAMPPKPRVDLQTQMAKIAEKQLVRKHRRFVETPNFIVVTDAPVADVAQKLANNLEAGYGVVNLLWKDHVPPQPVYGKVVCYMFSSEAAFKSLGGSGDIYEWAAGIYSPVGLIAFHMQMPTNEHLREAMLHETVHAFLDRHVVRPGASLPMWLDEGLADYIGNSEVRKKQLIPGKFRRHQIYHGPYGFSFGKSMTNLSAEEVKQAIRDGKAISLEDLVAAQRDEFYGEKRSMFYTESWMLVHFLRHGREEWADDRFPRFVLYIAEGYAPTEAMEHIYGVRPAELEDEFREYVKRF